MGLKFCRSFDQHFIFDPTFPKLSQSVSEVFGKHALHTKMYERVYLSTKFDQVTVLALCILFENVQNLYQVS